MGPFETAIIIGLLKVIVFFFSFQDKCNVFLGICLLSTAVKTA